MVVVATLWRRARRGVGAEGRGASSSVAGWAGVKRKGTWGQPRARGLHGRRGQAASALRVNVGAAVVGLACGQSLRGEGMHWRGGKGALALGGRSICAWWGGYGGRGVGVRSLRGRRESVWGRGGGGAETLGGRGTSVRGGWGKVITSG